MREHHPASGSSSSLSLGLAIGAVHEIIEWTLDVTVGMHLVHGERDTVTDLMADTTGSALGGLFLVAWSAFGWGTVRRVPARKLPPTKTGAARRG